MYTYESLPIYKHSEWLCFSLMFITNSKVCLSKWFRRGKDWVVLIFQSFTLSVFPFLFFSFQINISIYFDTEKGCSVISQLLIFLIVYHYLLIFFLYMYTVLCMFTPLKGAHIHCKKWCNLQQLIQGRTKGCQLCPHLLPSFSST